MTQVSKRRRPWYILGLPLIPVVVVVFVLAGWWDRYHLLVVSFGLAFSVASIVLQHRDNARCKRNDSAG